MPSDAPEPTPFGRLIRRRRVEAGRSLRDVADAIGISHVYLGEVERGLRGPLKREHWHALMQAIPGLGREELERAGEISRPLSLDLSDAPPRYQDLALALARRFKRHNLSENDIARLMRILGGSDE